MGMPATFIRLAGCNLRCEGCDTCHKTWMETTLAEIIGKVTRPKAIITGGEPTRQMIELAGLISLLCEGGWEVHIETNGTKPLPREILSQLRYVVVSPKVGSNQNLNYWRDKKNVHLKFVIGKYPWCWNATLLDEIVPYLEKERVWLMAYGIDQEMKGARDVWDLSLRLDVNYSDRLHIRLKGK